MKRVFTFLAFLLAAIVAAKADPVDVNRAKQVGAKFVNANTSLRASAQDLRLASTYRTTDGVAAFHVFNLPQGGWVMVAADDCATPILAYAFSGQFDENDLPPAMEEYLMGFVEQIGYGIASRLPALDTVAHQWQLVETTGQLTNDRSNLVVEPLLTTEWGQGSGVHRSRETQLYNLYCPDDPAGPNRHAVTGCTATAMAQIMRFWRWPIQGNGSHCYIPVPHPNTQYPEQCANFGITYYDWDNMPDMLNSQSTDAQNHAVAQLMKHCGVSIEMKYGPDESSANPGNFEDALEDYFKYSSDATRRWRRFHFTSTWLGYIKDDLSNGRPILYSGWNSETGGGHTFVVDGIRADNHMHINWGWNGDDNGYFALDALTPEGHEYNATNEAVFNIHPNQTVYHTVTATEYPENGGTILGYYINSSGIPMFNPSQYPHSALCILTATPNTGYHFVNWTTEDGEVVSYDASFSFNVIRDVHYIANFAPYNYTITSSPSPTAGGYTTGSGTYAYGTNHTLTAVPNTGYHFVNWKKNGTVVSTNATYSFTVTSNADYVATFALNNYTITTTSNPSAGGTTTGGGTYNYGSICNLHATANTSSGYHFASWTKDGEVVSTNAHYNAFVSQNATYIANFELNGYPVYASAYPTDGGSVTGAGNYTYGSTCTVTATANSHYHFVNWKRNGMVVSTLPSYSFIVTEYTNFVATFAPDTYQIAASTNPSEGGTVTGAGNYDYGTFCTLQATANSGYTFEKWRKDGFTVSYDADYTFYVTEPASYVALFEPNYFYVYTSATPNGSGTVTGAGNYSYGSTVTLMATPNEGYHFYKWTLEDEEVSTSPTYTFTMPAYSMHIYAHFETAITLGTYSLEFDEFGSSTIVNVPITIGEHLQGTPTLSGDPDWITAGISSDHTRLAMMVSPNPSTESRTCSLVVSVGDYNSQPLVITQYGQSPAAFTPNPMAFDFQTEDESTTWHYQPGDIYLTDINHVAQPYADHLNVSISPASESSWLHLGSWDAENQRYHFTVDDNTSSTAMSRSAYINIMMEGTDGTWIQRQVYVNQQGPEASLTLLSTAQGESIVPLCDEVTETFTVNYANLDYDESHPARIHLETYYFNEDDMEISYEPEYVEITSMAGTATFQATILVKNAGYNVATVTAYTDQYDSSEWQQWLASSETYVGASGLHPGNIDTKAASIETLNSLGIPSWYVMDPDTYQFVDTLSFIQVSIASESLGLQAEMVMPDPENNSYIITCTNFDPTYVSGSSTLIPLHDGTYLFILGSSRLAWDSDQGLHEEWVPMDTPDDIANIPAKCKWNITFSGENAIISPSTNANYSLRMVSEMVSNPENPEEDILDYRIKCLATGGTPLQIFYHIEGELPSPTFSEAPQYFEDGQSVTVTLTPAENTNLAYTLEEDYDNPVTSNVPVTLTFTETTKVNAWSMLECQTASFDGWVERTYYKVNTIAEARANANTEYYIHGIVSCADHVHNRYFVQDETSGVEISIDWSLYEGQYNNHDTLVSMQYGDEIVLKGWYDGYWFTGATWDWNSNTTYEEPEVAILSKGNAVTPFVITFDDLYETTDVQYLGRLVKLVNEQVTVSDFYPETYMLRHGTPEVPYYMEFPRYLENSDEMFPLNNGDIIDLTAVYDGGFSNPKEVAVKTGHTIAMQAYSDEALSTPSSALNDQIIYCDENGNALTPGSIYSETMVYFTIGSGYEVGLNNAQLPVAAVCDATTGAVIYDSYDNLLLEAYDLAGVPNRLFVFTMPDVDVTVKVWLEGFVMSYYITATANPMEGGTVTGDGNYAEGATCTLTATANEDYSFVNWTSVTGEVVSAEASYSFTVTNYAMFVANFVSTATYTITTTANPTAGGSVEGAGVYTVGETCTLTASANAGYTFINWTKNGEAITTDAICSFIVTEDADYVANFTLNSYAISVSANPSDGGNVSGEGTYNHGATVTLTATANEGYSFANWTKNGNVVSTIATYTFTATESAVYVANFGPSACTVTATANPTNGGTVEGTGTYDYGTVATLTANANEGYSFVNWTQGGTVVSTETLYSFTVNGNVALVANFTLDTYTVTVFANPTNAGTVTGGGEYAAGESCTLSATTNIGFNFIGWMSADGTSVSTDATYTFTVNGDGMFVANYEEVAVNYYTITATANPEEGGIVYDADTYAEGETCTLTAETYPGYTFVNWTRDGQVVSTETSYSFTVTEDADFVANFTGQSVYFTITAIANPEEGGTVSGGGSYAYGSTCTLTATANAGYNFVGWANTEGEIVLYDVTFDFQVFEDLTLVANFESTSGEYHTITASASPAVGGTVTGGGNYAEGSTCTLTATANTGYTFTNWTKNDEVVSTSATYTFTVTEDADLVANFTASEPGGDITQATNFTTGWNWYSTYVEQNGIDGLAQLEESLGTNGIQIKSQGQYLNYYEGMGWMGMLSGIGNESSYKIKTNAPCVINMTGAETTSSAHPITIGSGWNWIGYPVSTAMSIGEAMSSITPSNGDQLKGLNGYASYYTGMGWMGTLSTIEPGMGLLYKSNGSGSQTLVYPTSSKGGTLVENVTPENNHWVPDLHAYPDNMTVTAVVELDDNELQSDSYELAAFANGECRGSVRLMYVAPLNRYVAFLLISGNEAAELSFGLYDTETGMTTFDTDNALTYTTDATVGAVDEPYIVNFRGATGVDEWANSLQVFPNPVSRGANVSLGMTEDTSGEVQVEIVNALGAVLSVETSTKLPSSIKAPEVSGVYTLRITLKGKGTCHRKLVVR